MAAATMQGLSYPWARCPLPVHQALLGDEALTLLSGNASMEPGLGSVDGWGEGVTDGQLLRRGDPPY